MKTLRTITVEEHSYIAITADAGIVETASAAPDQPVISETDALMLDSLGLRRPGFCQRVLGGVKLSQHCGIVRLNSCVLEVLPKVGFEETRDAACMAQSRAALLSMLHAARSLRLTMLQAAPQAPVYAPLLDVFIEAFLRCALERARHGLLSRYVPHSESLPVIKGRFDVQTQLHRNAATPHLLHCLYDEFTVDNPYNRAILATISLCRSWMHREQTHRLWWETHSRYANVSHTVVTSKDVARLAKDRTTHSYVSVLTWCEWLLAMLSPSVSMGQLKAPGILFDMNKLFESHVTILERASTDEFHRIELQGPMKALAVAGATQLFFLKPDITVWKTNGNGSDSYVERIVDAKWKRVQPETDDWGIAPSDIYQVLAYAIRYQCRHVELAYPRPNTLAADACAPIFKIEIPGSQGMENVEVHVRLIPLLT